MREPLSAGKVLVLGREERAFLSVIRSLGRAGLHVHAGMCLPNELALTSRYVRRFHDIPAYQPGETNWIDCLEDILNKERFELVIPCDDHAVIPIQIHKERLARLTRIVALNDEAFRVAFDKIESHRLAARLGVCVPRSKVVRWDEPLDSVLDALPLPVVLKPPSSFTPETLSSKRAVIRARSREEVARSLQAAQEWGTVLVEENFVGTGVGVELLAKEGNTLFAFQHVRVHEPLEGGGSSYRKSTPLHPELLAASRALLRALDYTGVAMVEFKVDFRTGRWVFIEINGRFWGSLPLALAAGADFPRFLYEMLVKGRTEFPPEYRSNIYCRNVRADLRWMLANLVSDRSDPTLATRPLTAVAMEAINVLTLRERWDTLTLDDPRVGLVEGSRALRDAVRAAARVSRRTLASTTVGRRLAMRRAVARIRKARTILFVCKGNICRSPFAETYARRVLPARIHVLSSGYYPHSNREPPSTAVQVARTFGVDLASHRSTVLTREAVAQADLILVFDEENWNRMRTTYPFARGRLFRLGGMLEKSPLVIGDPFGKEAAAFEVVYRRIVQAIDRLAGRIQMQRLPAGLLETTVEPRGAAPTRVTDR